MRSKLFVLGSRPELFSKALASYADGISIDLEDAVQEDRKAQARERVSEYLRSPELAESSKTIVVRVNGLTTPHFEADVAAVARPELDLLNLPMTESADDVRAAANALARYEKKHGIAKPIAIVPNIESPRGLRRAAEIAVANPRVAGLQLGLGDLFEPLGIARNDIVSIHHVQLAVRIAAGEAGVWALDGAFAAVADPEGYKREAQAAYRLGDLGKTCIHPSQVAIANELFPWRRRNRPLSTHDRVRACGAKTRHWSVHGRRQDDRSPVHQEGGSHSRPPQAARTRAEP